MDMRAASADFVAPTFQDDAGGEVSDGDGAMLRGDFRVAGRRRTPPPENAGDFQAPVIRNIRYV